MQTFLHLLGMEEIKQWTFRTWFDDSFRACTFICIYRLLHFVELFVRGLLNLKNLKRNHVSTSCGEMNPMRLKSLII